MWKHTGRADAAGDGVASEVVLPVGSGRRFKMQDTMVSVLSQMAELGVFFAAAAALTFGALALR